MKNYYSDLQIARRSIRLVEDAGNPQIKFAALNWIWAALMLAMFVVFIQSLV